MLFIWNTGTRESLRRISVKSKLHSLQEKATYLRTVSKLSVRYGSIPSLEQSPIRLSTAGRG